VPSGQLRRMAPVWRARRSRVVAELLAEGARRMRRHVGHDGHEAADHAEARARGQERCGARGADGAKGTQVGLTVSGHQGPDDTNLAPRVAVRQWGRTARTRVSRPHPETHLKRIRSRRSARLCEALPRARGSRRNPSFGAGRLGARARESMACPGTTASSRVAPDVSLITGGRVPCRFSSGVFVG
jgi:hypothetical protein